ncbi:hypothetical protein FNV43_RR02422 [Rhamnella rubrinervis]|uniref:Uncharacterized protein n=1 Tax=Rhamnella rubrinervis TaxID=2594499 RepID=A0A8K0MTR7_9ROSA|nr:hypothetical protein FNV43_RR02422 [Rhamnella rubrinervis]
MSNFDESDQLDELKIGHFETAAYSGFKKERPKRGQAKTTIITVPNVSKAEFQKIVMKHTTSGHEKDKDFDILPEHLKWLLQYCLLFQSGYEFRKDKMVQLWAAEGFIRDRHLQRWEDMGSVYFNTLVAMEFIMPSRYDNIVDFTCTSDDFVEFDHDDSNWLYKLNNTKLQDVSFLDGHVTVASHKLHEVTDRTLHLSLNCKDIDCFTLISLEKFKQLQTLLLLPGYGSSVREIHRELFLSLRSLRTLDLSQTLISELPSSIGNVKSLQYLDVSHTLIKRLPESIDCLHNLQTLKLKGCLNLVGLPKGMKKLTKLRHLELDILRQLVSMPSNIGNLTNLRTLSAFLVGKDDGFRFGELKYLNGLGGTLCISRLENINSKEEAENGALFEKLYLRELELRWSDMRVEKAEEEEEILECLQPCFDLKELRILCYGGSKLPSWICNPSFDHLIGITIYKCKNCQLLPSLGVLPALKFLHISEMNEVKEINHQFHRNGSPQGRRAFFKLEIFAIDVMLNVEEWIGVEVGDLPSLRKLMVESCSKLVALPPLSSLNSLKHLEIKHCPMLHSLPDEGLPASLEFLLINDCPKLKERCSKAEGQDWGKIADVRSIWVDHQNMQ